ncbi:MAG: hypothetical protein IH859_00490 [Chloroflexi bacterium]|nr:hypothetical protein [Chloroflexota bacterium]
MRHDESAEFLFGIAKRARKYFLGLTTITQDIPDFLSSPYGKPIVTNAAIQILFKQSPAAIEVVKETFNLSEEEKYLLLQSEVGEGIFFAGLKHVAIKVVPSYTEDQIITSDPKQILEIRAQQKPHALILHTHRFGPHSKGDDTRSEEEIQAIRASRDPLTIHAARLQKKDQTIIEKEIDAEVSKAFETAQTDPYASIEIPNSQSAYSYAHRHRIP